MKSMRRSSAGGFTLVELVLVMGMLGFFLIYLTTMLANGLDLWQHGEERVAIEDRCATALRYASEDFTSMQAVEDRQFVAGRVGRFSRLQAAAGRPSLSGRLFSTWRGFSGARRAKTEAEDNVPLTLDWYPDVRFVARFAPSETLALLRTAVEAEIREADPEISDEDFADRLREKLAVIPSNLPGEVALRVVPTGEGEGAYLALHRQRRLLRRDARGRWVDGVEPPPSAQPIATNLLYVEFLYRSQLTRSFDIEPSKKHGPELAWDSARAGNFSIDEHPVLRFTLDLDEQSLRDPLDDIMPSWVQVRVVVDEGPDLATCALLTRDIDAEAKEIAIEFPERIGGEGPGWAKIGSEWVRFASVGSDRLSGVRRGQRFTAPKQHRAGARVHVGREAMIRIPIAVAREYWNG